MLRLRHKVVTYLYVRHGPGRITFALFGYRYVPYGMEFRTEPSLADERGEQPGSPTWWRCCPSRRATGRCSGNVHRDRPELDGPVDARSTASQAFLLEYLEGMPMKDVGWKR